MTPPRRKLSISSLSSVAYGCVKLGVGVTVAAGAVAYAAVQVYRSGPPAKDDSTPHDANETKTSFVSHEDETTESHAVDTDNETVDDTADDNEHSHHDSPDHSASTPEPTPPDSPLPDTPVDIVHDKAEKKSASPPRHRRKVSFAPIPETEEATFAQEPVVQVDPIVQPPTNDTTQTGVTKTAKKNKRKSQRKKKPQASTAPTTHAQNAAVSS